MIYCKEDPVVILSSSIAKLKSSYDSVAAIVLLSDTKLGYKRRERQFNNVEPGLELHSIDRTDNTGGYRKAQN
ncbi:hypothetical protein CIB48_g3131 [Xylaria polymorpha]|nr:hypothetical protein CIB48_g3131 [Xylaria polymorpha]